MLARAVVEVGLDGRGQSVIRTLRSEAPLLVRQDSLPGPHVSLLLVGGAAGPLGGDELSFELHIDDGAHVRVRSIGASLLQPGPRGTRSRLRTTVTVGADATLDWNTEPAISIVDSDHQSVTHLAADHSAEVTFSESVLLGRHLEVAGCVALRQRVEVSGVVVLDHEVVLGSGGPAGPGAHGDMRWMRSTITLGPGAAKAPLSSVAADRISGVFPLGLGASLDVLAGTDPAAFLV